MPQTQTVCISLIRKDAKYFKEKRNQGPIQRCAHGGKELGRERKQTEVLELRHRPDQSSSWERKPGLRREEQPAIGDGAGGREPVFAREGGCCKAEKQCPACLDAGSQWPQERGSLYRRVWGIRSIS